MIEKEKDTRIERIRTVEIKRNFMLGELVIPALKGISISIYDGEFVAITGKSGSGKTTLMHLIGCLDLPTSGEYFIDGQNVAHLSSDQLAEIRNKKIGFVFQKFNLLPDLTALENVALPALYASEPEDAALIRATELLKTVGLSERMEHYPYQLSGGQQQRVAVARSLMNNPSILLADEPTGNLDSETTRSILKHFTEINEKKKTTIILVTHEDEVAATAKRIINLKDGMIESDK